MVSRNIEYRTKEILKYYSSNRQRWEDFYPSERWVFRKIGGKKKTLGDILDVGCACGGLGVALNEKFEISSYTGIDIHKDAIKWAINKQKLTVPTTFMAEDIIEADLDNQYDMVVSLSCADWNLETNKIIRTCWKRVKPEGYFVISLRLTPEQGINDIKKSYQYINFSGDEGEQEVANYVVFNFREAILTMNELSPSPELIGAYGYWGNSSSTAVTPFNKLVFAVFYIKKSEHHDSDRNVMCEFNLPVELFL